VKIDAQRLGSVTVVSPRAAIAQGEVDEFCAAVEEFRRKTNGRMVLDFAHVPFLDSRGIEVLWDLADRQRAGGQTVKIAAVHDLCREILELTGVASQLDLFDTPESAVRSFL
jgi:type IV pilus assembly protein PilB